MTHFRNLQQFENLDLHLKIFVLAIIKCLKSYLLGTQ